MITLAGTSSDYINHFRGLSADVTANKHLPNTEGVMTCTGIKLLNGDELYCMDNGDTYIYDLENKTWILQ